MCRERCGRRADPDGVHRRPKDAGASVTSMPPLTAAVVPVMKALACVEGDRLGDVLRVCQTAQRGGGHLPLLVGVVEHIRHAGHAGVLHRAGRNDVDRDSLRAQFLGEVAGELLQCGLGGPSAIMCSRGRRLRPVPM